MDLRAGRELMRFAAIGVGTALRRAYSSQNAERFLSQSLGAMPGAPAKLAQLLGMRSFQEIPAPEALPIETVKALIEQDCPDLASHLESISESARTASIGQTHQGKLKTGDLIASKIQYPGVSESISSQIEAIFGVAGFSPAKKYDFDLQSTRGFLRQKLLEETDYQREAANQQSFYRRYQNSTVVIPRVYEQYSTARILTQSWEDSVSLANFAEQATMDRRAHAGSVFTAWLFDSMFGLALLHSDLNPTNYGVRVVDGELKLVVYDFGAVTGFTPRQAIALYHWISATEREDKDLVMAALESLGFSCERLEAISEKLIALSRVLFRPLMQDGLWDARTWNLQADLDHVLGQDKWWFRTAGPPWFLYFMRSCQGWHFALNTLGSSIDLQRIWHPWREQLRVLAQATPLDLTSNVKLKSVAAMQPLTLGAARSLRVLVTESQEDIADLTLPSRAIEDLESLLPEHVRVRCEQEGIRLDAIKDDAIRSGLRPQQLFTTNYGHRSCKVWLE